MTHKKRKFFSGSSLEAALVAAASEYGIPVDEVDYELIEKKHGFLRVRRNVVIRVDPESPQRAEGAPAAVEAEPAGRRMPPPPPRQREREEATAEAESDRAEVEEVEEPGEPEEAIQAAEPEPAGAPEAVASPGGRRRRRAAPAPEEEMQEEPEEVAEPEEADEEVEDEEDAAAGRRRSRRRTRRQRTPPQPVQPKAIPPIEQRLKKAKGKMADGVLEATDWLLDLLDLDVDAEVYQGEDRFEVELRGPDREMVIDEEGKVLSALEHLIPRVMHGVLGETSAIRVDSENFQEGREERLRQKAMQMAFEVRDSGKAEVLEPMDPADRRIVHIAVNDEAGVSTKSLGGGYYKRVKIYPD